MGFALENLFSVSETNPAYLYNFIRIRKTVLLVSCGKCVETAMDPIRMSFRINLYKNTTA